MPPPQRLLILGSTGSIGACTLDVVARHPGRFTVHALSANRNIEKLLKQCRDFHPALAIVSEGQSATQLQGLLRAAKLRTEVVHGADALCDAARSDSVDTVVAAIVGAAGLPSALAAAHAGKKILLANKEALVMSGALFMHAVRASGAVLLPVDSEHNAIFQCLPKSAGSALGVERLILTASGGPFRTRPLATLEDVTPDQACAHPTWVMGRKISVDSATMINKGLEVIEAHWLFDMPAERIEVLIHPQSIVHSMVVYSDQSVLAQLGNPDMRTPIAHALAYPERIESGVAPLDLTKVAALSFEMPDMARFPCLRLAFDAIRSGNGASTVQNAANEVAVHAFLAGRIRFTELVQVIGTVLDGVPAGAVNSIDAVLEMDKYARLKAHEIINKL